MEEKMTITIEKVDKDLAIGIDGQCSDLLLLCGLASIVKSCLKQDAFTVSEFLHALVMPEDNIEESGTITSFQIPKFGEAAE